MTHLLLWGNAYAQVIRNGKNEVVALYPLMPNKMSVDRDENGHLYYTYYRGPDEAIKNMEFAVTLQHSDVLHIPGLGFDGLVGYSPIAMAKNAIGMAIACEEYGAKFFANVQRRVAYWNTQAPSKTRRGSERVGRLPLVAVPIPIKWLSSKKE
jgi:HK97 family phage portal protein